MDEPLSNLDALLRLEMRAELKALLRQLGTTTIYVTHDQVEALSMGDRIAVMNAGRIVQVDGPLAVYDNPADTFVGGFIGNPPMNFLAAAISPERRRAARELSGGSFPLDDRRAARSRGAGSSLGIRAEAIEVEPEPGEGLIEATVIVVEPLGSHNLLTVKSGRRPAQGVDAAASLPGARTARSGCGSSRGGSAGWTRRPAQRDPARRPGAAPVAG